MNDDIPPDKHVDRAPGQEAPMLRIAGRDNPTYLADVVTGIGVKELASGNRDAALAHFCRALRIANRFGPAKQHVDRIAKDLFAEAIAVRDSGDVNGAIERLVRSVELNPDSGETRSELARLMAMKPARADLTKSNLTQFDKARAETTYREAIWRCVEFVATRGIDGDVLEFGVLGGWTARIFAETIRDLNYPCDLHLFDSFEGLPVITSDVDKASFDINRGVWQSNMTLPRKMYEDTGFALHEHIRDSLATVISSARIKIYRGYYHDVLQTPLRCKAAIVHLDCDLYSSTREVLDALIRDRVLQDGTLLVFDDWNCNRANPNYGQRRAFGEFLKQLESRWSASSFINYGPNAAVFILHDLTA